MANRKLKSLKFPGIDDTYILDAGNVNYSDEETYEEGSVGEGLNALKEDFDEKIGELANNFRILDAYLYAKNKYINSSMVETALQGYNLYKIPISYLDVVHVKWNTVAKFWGTLSSSYLIRFELDNGTYRAFVPTEAVVDESNKELVLIAPADAVNFVVCAYADSVDYVTVSVNEPGPSIVTSIVKSVNTAVALSEKNTIVSKDYLHTTNTFSVWSGSYYSFFIKVRAGDRFVWSETLSGISRHGVYRKADGTCAEILKTTTEFTFSEDALACLYFNAESTTITYYPEDSIKIEAKNILGDAGFKQFEGLNGVAFGSSITYRAQTTGGFLQYLPAMCGITFDNQGVGGSYILGNMLTAIKNYTGYSDKEICLLEGFVNDWYYNRELGTYTDDTETTVCGCVRSAIDYMIAQNQNMTIFLILDPYGQNTGGVNCASTAVNTGGYTQFEYYEEVAKVAESLGIPVIKVYAKGQMCENTPQYYIDNIHPNALGARQTANTIWSQMRQYFPNVTE